MKSFKSFLLEYLTDEQRKSFAHIKMTDEARKATDHFFGVGNDEVEHPINFSGSKSHTHRQIETHIGKKLSPEEYRGGYVADKFGRKTKIGKMIYDKALRDDYANDPSRKGINNEKYTARIVRGTEVAGQTNPTPNKEHPYGHEWSSYSCKDVEACNGENSHMLPREIKHGTVVMFVKDHTGKEVSRFTLQPYHAESGSGNIAYGINGVYGKEHPSFYEHANKIANALSPKYEKGLFRINPYVFNNNAWDDEKMNFRDENDDGGEEDYFNILHPKTFSKQ